ncbi:hypothetical protein [Thermotoga caldifontis]|uniref:hypothetical protein n=1 Tax=Thermotoga caldifontis TaxID=1508419 RepID=UPI000597B6C9|nr:hypothetical protein [Thermotoga caldifontis]
MRKFFSVLMLFFSLAIFAVYLSVDTRDGFAVHFPSDGLELYLGYRYSGLNASLPVYENIKFKIDTGVDLFSQSGFASAKVGTDFPEFSLYTGVMLSMRSATQENARFVERGNLDFALDFESGVLNWIDLGLSAQKTIFGFYQDITSGDWVFVVPPFSADSMGVLLEPFVRLKFESPIKAQIRLGYSFSIAWVPSLPSALIDLKGFRITFLAWVF